MRKMLLVSSLFLSLVGSLQAADDCSTLLFAARTGDYDLLHEYCSVGYDPTNQQPPIGTLVVDGIDADGNTAVAMGAMHGYSKIVERLIAAGARLNLVNKKRETPLMHAAKNGYSNIAHLLVNAGAALNIADTKGRTALMHAARKGHISTVILLKILGADVLLLDFKWQNALMHAAKNGHADIVRILKHAGTDINAASMSGMTALMYAAQFGHESVVRILLELGADVTLVNDEVGRNAAGIATICGYLAIAEILHQAMGVEETTLEDVD